jgi:hypothetical protein
MSSSIFEVLAAGFGEVQASTAAAADVGAISLDDAAGWTRDVVLRHRHYRRPCRRSRTR